MVEYFDIVLCEGKRIRDPYKGLYLEANKVYRVPKAQFWMRRLEDGDIEIYKKKRVSRTSEQASEAKNSSEPKEKKVSKKPRRRSLKNESEGS